MDEKFFKCNICGNVVQLLDGTGEALVCCGQKMPELIPGTVDASHEKHVPVYWMKDGKVFVKIGESEHPMTEVHYIEWIMLKTNKGVQRRDLATDDRPEAEFLIEEDEKVEAVYAYCNLHGLWKK